MAKGRLKKEKEIWIKGGVDKKNLKIKIGRLLRTSKKIKIINHKQENIEKPDTVLTTCAVDCNMQC